MPLAAGTYDLCLLSSKPSYTSASPLSDEGGAGPDEIDTVLLLTESCAACPRDRRGRKAISGVARTVQRFRQYFGPSVFDMGRDEDIVDRVEHLPVFVLPGTVTFPFESLTIDMRTGSNMAFAGMISDLDSGRRPRADRTFCVAPRANAAVGTIAVIDDDMPRLVWAGSALRCHVNCVDRYNFVGALSDEENDRYGACCERGPLRWCVQNGFPVIAVRRCSDTSRPTLPSFLSEQEAFPYYSPPKPRGSSFFKAQTRSSSIPKEAKRFRFSTVGIPYGVWLELQEDKLLQRIKVQAATPKGVSMLAIDDNLLKTVPSNLRMSAATPARWSFWFASALDVKEADKTELLAETIPALRLKRILRLLHSEPHPIACRRSTKQITKRDQVASHRTSFKRPRIAGIKRKSSVLETTKFTTQFTTATSITPLPVFDVTAFDRISRS
jgi:hypothetical protein